MWPVLSNSYVMYVLLPGCFHSTPPLCRVYATYCSLIPLHPSCISNSRMGQDYYFRKGTHNDPNDHWIKRHQFTIVTLQSESFHCIHNPMFYQNIFLCLYNLWSQSERHFPLELGMGIKWPHLFWDSWIASKGNSWLICQCCIYVHLLPEWGDAF